MNNSLFKNASTPEERYNELVDQLVMEHGWSKRKARRYLDAYAKRENARLVKEGQIRQAKLREEGKLIDVSEERAQLDAEFQEQLKAQNKYTPNTNEF